MSIRLGLTNNEIFARMRGRFLKDIGPDALKVIQTSYRNPTHQVITISGDQCTGKSTLTKNLGNTFKTYSLN